MLKLVALTGLAVLCCIIYTVNGHGRMMVPVSRASMWRSGYPTEPDYNDNEGFCGGYIHQWSVNNGKCGICGDAFEASPRAHEAPGGTWGNTGILVGEYSPGEWIDVTIEVTTQHLGYFVFKVCPSNNWEDDPEQDCFDEHGELEIEGGGTHYPMLSWDKGFYDFQVRLPSTLTCKQCIFQWTWTTGNNWGDCGNGTSLDGCGPQETFRACSDISILEKP